jgi:CDP-4-dehydro-6-deoxyglucose reductase, E1
MTQYDYPTAFSLWGEEEKAAIARVIESGRFTMGDEVAQFEAEFAAAHGRRHAIMVNSGSSANLIAIAALFHHHERPLRGPRHASESIEWENGHGRSSGPTDVAADRAIVPAIAWSTTYAPLVQHGLELDLRDVDATWNAPPNHLFWSAPRLIVIASILGNPCYGAEWRALADDLDAYVLEDNCESFWAKGPDGERCGSHGTLSTFSFFYSHQISAIEGGMILTDDCWLDRLCRMLRAHGWTRDITHPARFQDEYDFKVMGYNVRPLELHAAIARAQLRKADQFWAARAKNALTFMAAAAGLPVEFPTWRGVPNPFGLHFLCESTKARAALVTALRANGVDCRLPTGGSFCRHLYGARWANQQTPMADSIHDRGLFLGNAPFDITDKIERAVAVMHKTLLRKAA